MRRKSIGATSQAFHEPMSTGAFLEFLTRLGCRDAGLRGLLARFFRGLGLKCWSEDGNPASHDTVKLCLGKPSNAPQGQRIGGSGSSQFAGERGGIQAADLRKFLSQTPSPGGWWMCHWPRMLMMYPRSLSAKMPTIWKHKWTYSTSILTRTLARSVWLRIQRNKSMSHASVVQVPDSSTNKSCKNNGYLAVQSAARNIWEVNSIIWTLVRMSFKRGRARQELAGPHLGACGQEAHSPNRLYASFSGTVFAALLSGLEALTPSAAQLRRLDSIILTYGRKLMRGKACRKHEQPDGSIRYIAGACGPGLQGAWGPGPPGLGARPTRGLGPFPTKAPNLIFRKPVGGSLAKAWVSAETAASEVGTWRETKPGYPFGKRKRVFTLSFFLMEEESI